MRLLRLLQPGHVVWLVSVRSTLSWARSSEGPEEAELPSSCLVSTPLPDLKEEEEEEEEEGGGGNLTVERKTSPKRSPLVQKALRCSSQKLCTLWNCRRGCPESEDQGPKCSRPSGSDFNIERCFQYFSHALVCPCNLTDPDRPELHPIL